MNTFHGLLLTFGVLLLLLGLIGKIEAQLFKVGTNNIKVRIIVSFLGILFIILSFIPLQRELFFTNKVKKDSVIHLNLSNKSPYDLFDEGKKILR